MSGVHAKQIGSGLAALGFGHVEVGTVTPLPQPGNPKPRVFRLVEDEAVINRMGFPGNGSAYMAKSLKGRQKRIGLFRWMRCLSARYS
jgi:dihydroorotate dehydrogenase